jgi:glutaredoxin-dependent peroxiredoxin
VLGPGDVVPDVDVWTTPREEAKPLREVLGPGLSLLCFYVYDWSPTWTNELYLLRDRGDDLDAAGIRPFGISRDSAWSHRAWAETLGVDVPLLSDWNGEATRAFDVSFEPLGMSDVPMRTAFLIRDGETIEAAWMLGSELPDIDAVIAATSGSGA